LLYIVAVTPGAEWCDNFTSKTREWFETVPKIKPTLGDVERALQTVVGEVLEHGLGLPSDMPSCRVAAGAQRLAAHMNAAVALVAKERALNLAGGQASRLSPPVVLQPILQTFGGT
jgi:hypothetical protein